MPKAGKLAVFDVNTAEVVGHIPADADAMFAAGLEDVLVVHPRTGTAERWGLKSFERDASVALPIKGVILGVAMGSASKGPLLVRHAAGNQALDRAGYSLFHPETLKIEELKIASQSLHMNHRRDFVHIRAAANGRVFGMWCTSHTPNGVAALVLSDPDAKVHYTHASAGYVLPGRDGKELFTGSGKYKLPLSITGDVATGPPVVTACHGDSDLTFLRPGTGGDVTVTFPDARHRSPR